MILSYQTQRILAIVVGALLAGCALIQVADPADFGLTPVMVHWLNVLVAMLGVVAGVLPSVRGMGTDPVFLANRISELPKEQQQAVATILADRETKAPADAQRAREG